MMIGQWFTTPEGTTWWFDPGAISLDFGYTGGLGDNPAWEQWHRPEDLGGWLAERFEVTLPITADDLVAAKRLRGAIAVLVDDAAAHRALTPTAQAVVDEVAARPDSPPQLGPAATPTAEQLLSTIARDAVVLLRDRADRLRICAADDCQLTYLDSSRAGNRTWCSMKRCGNRHKIRQLRARQRAESDPTVPDPSSDEGDPS